MSYNEIALQKAGKQHKSELASKDAEIAALREALDKCHELTYRPIALTQHLKKALEATK